MLGVAGFPILEDDFFRYLWDGFQWVEYGNPYTTAPAAFFADDALDARFDDILGHINYPQISTVYGSVNQWFFAIAYYLAPAQIWPLQIATALADLALIIILLPLAQRHLILLYAWSPLIIKEFAFTAHPDIFAVLLVSIAVRFSRQGLVAAFCLGLAVNAKVFALLAVPFILRWRIRWWIVFVGVATAATWPFGTIAWFNEGLGAMSGIWSFNAPLTQALGSFLPAPVVAWVTTSLLAVLYVALLWCYRNAKMPPLAATYGIYLLCAPVVNAWYWIWVVAFALCSPQRWPWIGLAVMPLAYLSGINLGSTDPGGAPLQLYQLPNWVLITEVLAIAAALLWDFLSWRRSGGITSKKNSDPQVVTKNAYRGNR